ncbi:hypothetical protein [Cellulomonas edaphi]|uniref:Uncharacterized protein n=1 Tax=Cellulomonas edaphi TaxID=3053468 RepID=A0ABT7S333_9CELL|nr:hypothetical protein [Cellulomons edaphi]MDM7830035.1 hypothetical protein [Cellulomons edaphi]
MDTTGYPAEPIAFPASRTAAWSAIASRLAAVSHVPAQREDVAA